MRAEYYLKIKNRRITRMFANSFIFSHKKNRRVKSAFNSIRLVESNQSMIVMDSILSPGLISSMTS